MDKKYLSGIIEDVFQISDSDLFFKKLRDTIFDHFNPDREYDYYHKLPRFSKMVIALYSFYTASELEGFGPFLLSSSGDFSEDIKDFLKNIKAYKTHDIMEEISSFFPGNKIPEDEVVRNDIIYDLKDSVPDFDFFDRQTLKYNEHKDDIPKLLKYFLETNIIQFVGELKSYCSKKMMSEEQIKECLDDAEKEVDLIEKILK
ncbi:hypothetical protein DENIS_4516 [Desulfonema ishimotonii]|uniref:DNA mimic protein DMP19 C-terminal domain-containing protein n=1 Tax=Desulfonema ishimotonii TaxID=45657 RepID=A0A401G2P6_9BACT|nr:DUF4375 domain-containing protein [Desulfonema ishimotonii]GBC63522.1 hypothetical protein DENIS_4516 [Desulfonema ishimotonii]